jgi:hypothetical protein
LWFSIGYFEPPHPESAHAVKYGATSRTAALTLPWSYEANGAACSARLSLSALLKESGFKQELKAVIETSAARRPTSRLHAWVGCHFFGYRGLPAEEPGWAGNLILTGAS